MLRERKREDGQKFSSFKRIAWEHSGFITYIERGFSMWSNKKTSTAFIIFGCFLLVWLIGYRIGYRIGRSRHNSGATTTAPSLTYAAGAAHLETENENGKMVSNSPALTEEFGTQELFSYIFPYLRRFFHYVEE